MRGSRLLIVMLAAHAVGGCLRRDALLHYASALPPAAETQAPAYQALTRAMPPPATAPAARGLFMQSNSLARTPKQENPCGAQGCAASPVAQAPAHPAAGHRAYAAYPPQAGVVQGYALDAGDRLRITVFGQQGLTNSYAVDAAGNITMPLIVAVPGRGLTTEQLSQSISERLRQGSIREPRVAIEIEAHRPFFIHGEVGNPGQYLYVANMTVQNAVAIAGGFGPRADMSKVTLTRGMGGQTTNAAVGLNHPVRPGDTLRIGKKWF